ncbi:hypothetical protein ABH933_001259 [Nocardia sp. GP40]|uniref:hypothetical protein n=1 Tax=Nocardia sp. GP40 TaxID=3156268 RepID=UPI003D1D0BAA
MFWKIFALAELGALVLMSGLQLAGIFRRPRAALEGPEHEAFSCIPDGDEQGPDALTEAGSSR